jgi:hypothetical protein
LTEHPNAERTLPVSFDLHGDATSSAVVAGSARRRKSRTWLRQAIATLTSCVIVFYTISTARRSCGAVPLQIAISTAGHSGALAPFRTELRLQPSALPIMTFFAQGFEHSIVNMFVVPAGMMFGAPVSIKVWLLWNQLPVTLGNIISGALFTGLALYAPTARSSLRQATARLRTWTIR